MGSVFAHEGLVRDDYERAVELYRADPDDIEGISDPAAGLMSRRMPAGAANPDLADGIGLLFAIAGYIAKQFAKMAAARQMKVQDLQAPQFDQQPEESSPGWPMQSPAPQQMPTEGAA